MASKRQVFKRGQKVFICVSKEGKYSLPIWIPAVVANPNPKLCPNKSSWHYCYSECEPVADPRFVDIIKLDREGKKQLDTWGKKQVRNVRNVILDEETAKPLLEELAHRQVQRGRNNKKRQVLAIVTRRIEKAAVPMAKALKKVQVILNSYPRPPIRDETVKTIVADTLELLKAPKKTED